MYGVASKKLFGIYFGGYTEDISGDLVSSFPLLRSIASYVTKRWGDEKDTGNSSQGQFFKPYFCVHV